MDKLTPISWSKFVKRLRKREDKLYPVEVNMAGKPTRALHAFMEFYNIVDKGVIIGYNLYTV